MSIYSKGEITCDQTSIWPASPWIVCQAESTLQETIKTSNEDDSQSSIDVQIYITSSYCRYFTMPRLWDAISGGLHLFCRAWGCQGQISRAGCNLNSGRVQINAVKEKRKLQCLQSILFQQRAKGNRKKVCVGYTGLSLSFFLPSRVPTGIVRSLILVSDSRCLFHSYSQKN